MRVALCLPAARPQVRVTADDPRTNAADISRPAGFENKGESPQFMQLVRLFEDYEDADGRKKKHNSGFRRPLLDAFFKVSRPTRGEEESSAGRSGS